MASYSYKEFDTNYQNMKTIIEIDPQTPIDVEGHISNINSDFVELFSGMVLSPNNAPWYKDATDKVAAGLVAISNGATKLLTGPCAKIKEADAKVYGSLYTNLSNLQQAISEYNLLVDQYNREIAAEALAAQSQQEEEGAE